MASNDGWTILGPDQLAANLVEAARFVDIPSSISVTTDDTAGEHADVGTGRGALGDVSRAVSQLFGFRVLEDLASMLRAGEPGKVYGCFGSYRISREATAGEVMLDALLPLVGYVLDIFGSPISRVMARRASLFKPDDAWYVTIRLADEVLLTLEAMAATAPLIPPDIMLELTAADRVLRAEPTRQSVTVEPLAGPVARLAWWENEAERLLHYIAAPTQGTLDPARLRSAWDAIQQSAESGEPVMLTSG